MTAPRLKIKVLPRPVVKVRALAKFPSDVVGSGGISVTKANGRYTIAPSAGVLGDVSGPGSGASVAGEIAVFTDGNNIEGATLAELGIQPLDSDLTAIALLSTTTFGRALLTSASAAALVTSLGLRTHLTANTTFYVRTAGATNPGSNSNDGLTDSAGGAWLTINYAIQWIRDNIDANGHKVVVQVADDATITETVQLFPVHGVDPGGWSTNALVLRGNTTTLGNVKITATGNYCLFGVNVITGWRVEGFEFSTITSGTCILADFGSVIYLGKNKFGACAGTHLQALYGSKVEFVDDYTISGAAAVHWYGSQGGQILIVAGKTITISGTPAFSSMFAYVADCAVITALGLTFSGSATGSRYSANRNGSINVNGGGASYLPGDSAGSTGTGGQYN